MTADVIKKKAVLNIMAGVFVGWFILHPAAIFIKDAVGFPLKFNWNAFSVTLSMDHLPMAVFFVLIGVAFSVMNLIYVHRLLDMKHRVATLEGMLVICANCKRIRIKDADENDVKLDEWVPVESYITERSSLLFSHAVCPKCMEKLYPELKELDVRVIR